MERIQVLYAWIGRLPDGKEIIITGDVPGVGHIPFVTRYLDICETIFRPICKEAQRQTGQEIKLVSFFRADNE